MQWTQWNSGIWRWGNCFWCKNVKPVDTVDTKNSDMHVGDGVNVGDVVNSEYYVTFLHQRQCPHHHIPLLHCIYWFDLFAPKTMSPPPYTTIPLCPLV